MHQFFNATIIAALTTFVGCQQPVQVGSQDLASTVCSSSATRLMAGQSIHVGTVSLTQDETHICVDFQITDSSWILKENHLAIATDPELLPQTGSGNPQVGHFPYHHYDLNTQRDTFCVDYVAAGYAPGETIYVAAHAVVAELLSSGGVGASETAWGEGDGFSGKNWAMYFNHTLSSCNQPPVAVCQDVPACPSTCDQIDAGSYDPDGADDVASVTCSFSEDRSWATVVITDQAGLTSSCTGTFDLSACNQPPVAVCKDLATECPLSTYTCDEINGGSYDPDGEADIASITCDYNTDGSASLTITDMAGETTSCTATVTVADTTAPEATVSSMLMMAYPRSYALEPYSLANCAAAVTDNCGGDLDIDQAGAIVSISSDEPVIIANHPSCADATYAATHDECQDIQIQSNSQFRVRNTRASGGNGRVYTVTFTVTDTFGNISPAYTCQIGVRTYSTQIPTADAPAYTVYP